MGSGFTLKPRADLVDRLRTSFPDLYDQLLEWADPDTPHLMYFAFAGLLLECRDNAPYGSAHTVSSTSCRKVAIPGWKMFSPKRSIGYGTPMPGIRSLTI